MRRRIKNGVLHPEGFMMLSCRRWVWIVFVGAIVTACGGSDSGGLFAGDDGGTDAGRDGPSGGGDATVNDSGGPAGEGGGGTEAAADVRAGGDDASGTDSALGTDGADDGAGNDGTSSQPDGSDAASDVAAPPCPDVSGAYSIAPVEAQGCKDLNLTAPQCIRQGQQGPCDISFQSNPSGGAVPAINGDPTLQGDGSFTGGALTEGTQNRTGCTGSWNAMTSTMTVDCGGTNSMQACVVTLVRTSNRCN
jgi:hypothetical protein